jgi:hypothetical protein
MTALDFWAGVLLGAATVIACYELCDALFRLQADQRGPGSDDRPSSIPAYTREAEKARTGVWTR